MSKKIVLFVILFSIINIPCYAMDLSLSINQAAYRDVSIESAQMAKVIAKTESLPFYLWGSFEAPYIAFGGQEACRAIMYGVGAGISLPILDSLKLNFDLGYFITSENIDRCPTFKEAMIIYTNQAVYPEYDIFTHYEYKLSNAPGGSIGLTYEKQISQSNWYFLFSTSYRYLKIMGTATGTNPGIDEHWWDIPVERDFSCFTGGIGIKYQF